MITNRIKKLREKFKDFEIDGYIIPKNDEFFSEYAENDRLKNISKFTGSAGLAIILTNNNGILRALDFGGSLGSSYFQNKHLLSELNLEWSIVEQSHFVEYGKKELSDNTLQFYMDIEECLSERKLDVIMISNTLQYLEDPYQWLNCFINSKIDYIFVDTATFSRNQDEYITIQHVSPKIYNASYPCWFFNKEKMLKILDKVLSGETPKPGSYRGRINNEPENNRKTLMDLKNA